MSFELGDTVEPQTIITFSGTDFDLTGTSGTVIDRQVNGATSSGTSTYLYKVELFEPLTVGSGIESQSEDIFWFTEAELGGEGSEEVLDFNGVNSLLQSGTNTVVSNQATISETLSQVSSTSPYYVDINQALDLANNEVSTVISQDISDGSKGSLSVASGVSEISSFSSEIYKEISDNLFGFYTLVSEVETQLTEEESLSKEQELKALEDDEINFNTFYSAYVDTPDSTNLLSPSGTADSESNNSDVSDLIDASEITADLLNAESIALESD